MEVTLMDTTGNKAVDVDFPDATPVGRLIGEAAAELELPNVGPDGPVSYKFLLKRTGQQLADGHTLAQAGVRRDDVLRLVPEITAG